MFMSYHQNVGQSNNLLTANKSLENVAKFKYLEAPVSDPNCIHEELKCKFVSFHFISVQFSFRSAHFISVQGVTATILFTIFCLPAFSVKTYNIKKHNFSRSSSDSIETTG
jgi:hypothetical protein